MRLTYLVPRNVSFAALMAVVCTTTTANAQTIINNETLVNTTFVTSKTEAIAQCHKAGCKVKRPMLTSIPVTCPAAIGATCTFQISLDTTISVEIPCSNCSGVSDSVNSYQFLMDGVAPTPGPTDEHGDYIFSEYVTSAAAPVVSRHPYPTSILATVTNSSSQNHALNVNLQCHDLLHGRGCGLAAHWSTVRIDVFEP